ncbi:hypothetical protein [Bradyrhizobium sp. 131]|uniref:hypothetical protein n=1 Tax=unclassified Bradyrhizobium TaxID=2631580 RepID=UPI0031F9D549
MTSAAETRSSPRKDIRYGAEIDAQTYTALVADLKQKSHGDTAPAACRHRELVFLYCTTGRDILDGRNARVGAPR